MSTKIAVTSHGPLSDIPKPTLQLNVEKDLGLLLNNMLEPTPFHEEFMKRLCSGIENILQHYISANYKLYHFDYFIRIINYSKCDFDFVLMVRYMERDRQQKELTLKYK